MVTFLFVIRRNTHHYWDINPKQNKKPHQKPFFLASGEQ
jgi:hypothetical protein